MEEVISDINNWRRMSAEPIGLATVIETWGSAPRKVGAKMALRADGSISGSVSGGCVEGAVFEAGLEVLETGRPQLLHFGVADETAWDVGLACGGTIEVFVEPLDADAFQFTNALVNDEEAGATVTIVRGPDEVLGRKLSVRRHGGSLGTLGSDLDERAVKAIQEVTDSQRMQLTEDVEVFIDVTRPAPTLVMVGGVHIAIALTNIAKTLDYRTIVVDPRRAFGSEERFPHVDQLIQSWPDKAFSQIKLTPDTAVALLTHDPKIDDPALKVVLNSPVFYIGALGSRKTHARRRKRLGDMGFGEAEISRIHGPIGLDIGATTPEEIGVAIMAEIVRARRSDSASGA